MRLTDIGFGTGDISDRLRALRALPFEFTTPRTPAGLVGIATTTASPYRRSSRGRRRNEDPGEPLRD